MQNRISHRYMYKSCSYVNNLILVSKLIIFKYCRSKIIKFDYILALDCTCFFIYICLDHIHPVSSHFLHVLRNVDFVLCFSLFRQYIYSNIGSCSPYPSTKHMSLLSELSNNSVAVYRGCEHFKLNSRVFVPFKYAY